MKVSAEDLYWALDYCNSEGDVDPKYFRRYDNIMDILYGWSDLDGSKMTTSFRKDKKTILNEIRRCKIKSILES